MADAKFTPGPWRIDGLLPDDGWGATGLEDSVELACLPHETFDALEIFGCRKSYDDFDEFKANAHLIAAAPDLYEALVEAREAMSDGDPYKDMARQMAEAALAKARGQ